METPVRIVITADSREALRELLRQEDLDLACGGAQRTASGEWVIEALAPEEVGNRLHDTSRRRDSGYRVRIDRSLSQRAAQRQLDVGSGDRFAGGQIAPRGLGRKE